MQSTDKPIYVHTLCCECVHALTHFFHHPFFSWNTTKFFLLVPNLAFSCCWSYQRLKLGSNSLSSRRSANMHSLTHVNLKSYFITHPFTLLFKFFRRSVIFPSVKSYLSCLWLKLYLVLFTKDLGLLDLHFKVFGICFSVWFCYNPKGMFSKPSN